MLHSAPTTHFRILTKDDVSPEGLALLGTARGLHREGRRCVLHSR
jgi:hypothetical protein